MSSSCGKTNNFKVVCRNNNGRKHTVHDTEQETVNDNKIEMININSISFNSK